MGEVTLEVLDVLRRIQEVREASYDAESAHLLEDKLHAAVLEHIAAGPYGKASDLAAAALTSRDIDFPRYCA